MLHLAQQEAERAGVPGGAVGGAG